MWETTVPLNLIQIGCKFSKFPTVDVALSDS